MHQLHALGIIHAAQVEAPGTMVDQGGRWMVADD
jgi:hypothetical protein